MNKKRIIYLINSDWFFLSHRASLAEAAQNEGFEVHVVAPDTGRCNEIIRKGFVFHPIPLLRSGINPFYEWSTIKALKRIHYNIKPDLYHNVTLKSIIYGTYIAKKTNTPVINAVSGLGYSFVETNKTDLLKLLLKVLLKSTFKHQKSILIFQNPDDIIDFKNEGILNGLEKISLIKGSGVDTEKIKYSGQPNSDEIQIMLHSRMIWDKGIEEFVKAAGIVKKNVKNTRFILVGGIDQENKRAIPKHVLQRWNSEGNIEWLGFRTDIELLLKDTHICVLPSYYREGVPKSLLEAAAAGKPIITTNSPGCREVVDDNINGLLIDPRNVNSLAEAIIKLVNNESLRKTMGERSREKALSEYSLDQVIKKTLDEYKKFI